MRDEAVRDGEAAQGGSNVGALGAREEADVMFGGVGDGRGVHLILFEWRRRLFGRAAEMTAGETSEMVGGWLRSLSASACMKQPVMVLTPLKSFHKYASSFLSPFFFFWN